MAVSLAFLAALLLSGAVAAQEILAGGFFGPVKIATTIGQNLVVAETGTGMHDGAVHLVSPYGPRFPLVTGLPSASHPEGISGPTGVVDAHSTLWVLIGEGDVLGESPPPVHVPNPNGLSSPIWSAVLEMVFDPVPDGIREGFALDASHERALADGKTVSLTNDSGESVRISVLTDFRDLEPDPFVGVRQSNPFDIAMSGGLTTADLEELGYGNLSIDQAEFKARLLPDSPLGQRLRERTYLFVTDAGMNTVNRVSAATGRWEVFWRLPPVPNPLFPNLGGPVSDAVPTSVHVDGDRLLVGHLAGFPFAQGSSTLWSVDLGSGEATPLVPGLTSVTDVFTAAGDIFVAQVSNDLLGGAPGSLLRIGADLQPQVVAPVLIGPTGITWSPIDDALVVAETFTGLLKTIPVD